MLLLEFYWSKCQIYLAFDTFQEVWFWVFGMSNAKNIAFGIPNANDTKKNLKWKWKFFLFDNSCIKGGITLPLRGPWCGHNRKSPHSFCNGLGTIYSVLSRKDLFYLTTRDMGSEFKYDFGKVLGTQNRPTLRFASSHCVLCLNPIKGIFNIAF